MIFSETKLKDVFIVELERIEDNRGFFARTWCRQEFEGQQLDVNLAQCSISFNKKKGTLRGMHYQTAPYEEVKLVRCTMGSMYDVVVDLRAQSPTFKQWLAIELTAENRKMIYIPKGVAHGFQTLENNTEVLYQMSEFYHPDYATGVRWNDPAFNINWPLKVQAISDKDRQYLDFIE